MLINNIPTFRVRDSDGNPSDHEAVHIIYVRELLKENANLISQLANWESEMSKVMPADFKDWWGNNKKEWPVVARMVIESLKKREDEAWNQLEIIDNGNSNGAKDEDLEGKICYFYHFLFERGIIPVGDKKYILKKDKILTNEELESLMFLKQNCQYIIENER